MRVRVISIVLISTALGAAAALASMSGGSAPAPPTEPSTQQLPPPPSLPAAQAAAAAAERRQKAEAAYAEAYDLITRAKLDLDAKKDKDAEKKFKKATESGETAVRLDSHYHEAWNLIGFAYRKLGNYDKAFAAYDQCLGLKPDYTPAREYVGEAWLEMGHPEKAREQLVMLEHYKADADANLLRGKIAAYESAHPESAHPDSSVTKASGSSGQ
jgi:tetratricopeptide (TPR) repeat protein